MFVLNLGNLTIRRGVTWLQAVTRRTLTAKNRFDLCGIYGVQGATGPSFLRELRLCPVSIIPTMPILLSSSPMTVSLNEPKAENATW
jgi:hypothetical protein